MLYKVKLDIFEGPFDLLVYLIESAEMNIYDIQISQITSQYLLHIEEMKTRDITVSAEFMVLAATLVEIKSKMLLPRVEVDGEPIEDPRTELVEKLIEYKKFKYIAAALEEAEILGQRIYEKPQEDISAYTGNPDEFLQLDVEKFLNSFEQFIEKKRRVEEVKRLYEKVEREKVTVASKISFIKNLFKRKDKKSLSFSELLPEKESAEDVKYEKVLTFVSMLEMIKDRVVRVKQRRNFDEIIIEIDENNSKAEEKIDVQ